MIEKLEDKKELIISGQTYNYTNGTNMNIYSEIMKKPSTDEIINKINEIIDYINSKEILDEH